MACPRRSRVRAVRSPAPIPHPAPRGPRAAGAPEGSFERRRTLRRHGALGAACVRGARPHAGSRHRACAADPAHRSPRCVGRPAVEGRDLPPCLAPRRPSARRHGAARGKGDSPAVHPVRLDGHAPSTQVRPAAGRPAKAGGGARRSSIAAVSAAGEFRSRTRGAPARPRRVLSSRPTAPGPGAYGTRPAPRRTRRRPAPRPATRARPAWRRRGSPRRSCHP